MGTLLTDKSWNYYGEKAPYFAIFGQEEYLNSNLTNELKTDVFASGSAFIGEIFKTIHSRLDPDFHPNTILDFGCGPGRLTIPLSKYASEVVGMDVSSHMLAEAKENCRRFNVQNAEFVLSDDQLQGLHGRKFDLVFSFIVLQHLNIKRGEKIFDLLLKSIGDKGIGVLQLTYRDHFFYRTIVNYFRYRIPFLSGLLKIIRCRIKGREYIYLPPMQMNNYNLNKIFFLLQKSGITEVYSTFTNHHNYLGLMLYVSKDRLNTPLTDAPILGHGQGDKSPDLPGK
ncbi:MAG: class I SAM-dependent methyltransferase [Bacteroidota bacterium]